MQDNNKFIILVLSGFTKYLNPHKLSTDAYLTQTPNIFSPRAFDCPLPNA